MNDNGRRQGQQIGEVAVMHLLGRERGRQRRSAPLAEAFVAAEEEGLVLEDGTADRAAELIAPSNTYSYQ